MDLSIQSISGECPNCGGTGTEDFTYDDGGVPTPGTRECTMCGGAKRISSSALSEDLITLLNDMSDRIDDILEKVNE